MDFQIGHNNNEFQDRINYNPSEVNANMASLGIESLTVANKEGAQTSLATIDGAIEKIAGQRASLGAIQNRLVSTSKNLETSTENMAAANSRIRDVDYADVTAENARNNILNQAATSVLAQSNAQGQGALRLIG